MHFPFTIKLDSDISNIVLPSGIKCKPGLGSSSAVAVAVISCVLEYHDIGDIPKHTLYKLSVISQYVAQQQVYCTSMH